MEDETRPTATEPPKPASEPEEGEMLDEELDEIAGGKDMQNMQNYWQMMTNLLKQQGDTQGRISGNFR